MLALLGIAFGAFAPEQRWWRSRPFAGAMASAGAFTFVAMASYAVSPDWMWMYFLDPDEVSWSVPLFVPAYLFTTLVGFAAAVALKRVSRWAVWGAAAVTLLLELWVVALTWDRYRSVGTRREWVEGTAAELFSASPTGDARAISLLGPVFIAVLLLSAWLVWRDRRAAAADR